MNSWKPYNDSTLMSMTKEQLINLIRCLENNCRGQEERIERQFEFIKLSGYQPLQESKNYIDDGGNTYASNGNVAQSK